MARERKGAGEKIKKIVLRRRAHKKDEREKTELFYGS